MAVDLLASIICPGPGPIVINPNEEFTIRASVINIGDSPAINFTFQFALDLLLGTTVALTGVSGTPVTSAAIGQPINGQTLLVVYPDQSLPAAVGSASALLEYSITIRDISVIRGPIPVYPRISAIAPQDIDFGNNDATCTIYLS